MNQANETSNMDKIVLLMVSGISKVDLGNACVTKLGLKPNEVADAIALARRRLTLAADYNRDEQIGTAITRMNDIYGRAIRAGDIKTAVTAQREINKLMDLYREAAGGTGGASGSESDGSAIDEVRNELAAIRDHLLPLGLADESYPLREHARITADLIRDHHNGRDEEGA